jgi:hypothetical protein
MNLTPYLKQIERFVTQNSPVILTTVGVVGSVATAYLAGRASFKASTMIREEQERLNIHDNGRLLTTKDKVNLVWAQYVPAVGLGAVSVVAIIGANRIDTRRAAALAAAYSLSEKAFAEYKEQIVAKAGPKKEATVRDSMAQARVDKNPPPASLIVGDGNVLCQDSISGRYFESKLEDIRRIENDLTREILDDGMVSLSDVYGRLGLETTAISDELGWNSDHRLEIVFSTALTPDGRPCAVMDFEPLPRAKFYRYGH